jgi:pimeloyl-ACP methyl ester carboxylesterase
MTIATKSATLDVPGATIYHEVQGTGPVLLLIPGGPQDAGVFTGLAAHLADRYTVVAVDPRGNSRSVVTGEPGDLDVDLHADDAARLIAALGEEPAFVFGTSGGGQVALSLAARHPERVRTVVAHEPSTVAALDDPGEALAADQAVVDTYRREGVDAAMALFFAQNALGDEPESEDGPPELDLAPEEMETFARVSGNFEYWLAHGLMPLSLYVPDIETLRAGVPRVVVGIGEESAGQVIHAIGIALAGKLDVEPVVFPGDHMGFELHAGTFADVLDQALGGA